SSPHTSPSAIYTLSLHDALPILFPLLSSALVADSSGALTGDPVCFVELLRPPFHGQAGLGEETVCSGDRAFQRRLVMKLGRVGLDRKSTRLNSSHLGISYAVFCL